MIVNHTGKQSHDRLPALTHVHGRGKEEYFECSVASVDSMVEELSQWTTLVCSAAENKSVTSKSGTLFESRRTHA